MEADISKVYKSRLFENVSEDVISNCIIPNGSILSFEQGESLFLPLDRVDTIQILLSGKIKLVYYMETGKEDIRNILFPGNLIGADLICTHTRLSPYQAAAGERCVLFSAPSDIILKPGVLPEKDRLSCLKNLLLIISHINMQNEYRLAILTRNSLRERIMVYLTMQANRNRSHTFTIPFNRDEMASFLCVNRSALSHELGLMRQEGIVDFSKNRFTLIKTDKKSQDIQIGDL